MKVRHFMIMADVRSGQPHELCTADWMNVSMQIEGWYIPTANNATILTTINGGSHSETNASTAYCANDKQMIAICDGFNTNVDTHENRNAGAAPNASIKYAHSAPEDVFIVPSSAYASAPTRPVIKKNGREMLVLDSNRFMIFSEIIIFNEVLICNEIRILMKIKIFYNISLFFKIISSFKRRFL